MSDRVKISLDDDNSVLTIRKATVIDAGEYTCVAKNFFAEARQSTTLHVDGENIAYVKIDDVYLFPK